MPDRQQLVTFTGAARRGAGPLALLATGLLSCTSKHASSLPGDASAGGLPELDGSTLLNGARADSAIVDDESAAEVDSQPVGADDSGASADVAAEGSGPCTGQPPGNQCNELVPSGSPISVTCNTGQTIPMASAGGTISNGTYVLSRSTYYGTCPTAETDRIVWQVCGSSWQTVQEVTQNGEVNTVRLSATVYTNGSRLSVNLGCGETAMVTFGYDATSKSLILYEPQMADPSSGRLDIFVRM